ncbi:hypothetical protein PZ897_01700 [Hoeflea sp. YIM 152468]|uniref:hypothetical protein n=1 Tax=Hoeflea sp. YIM 152468 TaxID=3031759 RepID=UPI0023DA0F11|nr:hypothetical protein [Hoeflea sp. YIM 152468]MDF1606883.1 hypothetical protein [Hoeflea sp. YIM 152468]
MIGERNKWACNIFRIETARTAGTNWIQIKSCLDYYQFDPEGAGMGLRVAAAGPGAGSPAGTMPAAFKRIHLNDDVDALIQTDTAFLAHPAGWAAPQVDAGRQAPQTRHSLIGPVRSASVHFTAKAMLNT